jgi:diguanylate cyclase (GGDEF)-like protein
MVTLYIGIATAALVYILLSFFFIKKHNASIFPYGISLMVLSCLWLIAHLLEIGSSDPMRGLLWNYVKMVGLIWVPMGFLFFVLSNSGLRAMMTWRRIAPFLLITVVFTVLVLTNEHHHWMFTGITAEQIGACTEITKEHRAGFHLFFIYSFFLYAISLFFIGRTVARRLNRTPFKGTLLIFAGFLPLLAGMGDFFGFFQPSYLDLMPISFVAVNAIMILIYPEYHLDKFLPLARSFIFEQVHDPIFLVDKQLTIVDVNESGRNLVQTMNSCKPAGSDPLHLAEWSPELETLVRSCDNNVVSNEISLCGNGETHHFDASVSQVNSWSWLPYGYIVVLRDIAVRKETEQRLENLAYYDQLTLLGNREHLIDSLDRLLASIKREPEQIGALLFIDLDRFKKINDSMGHDIGDEVLKEIARRISQSLRAEDQVFRLPEREVFRLGGDEFTILLTRLLRPEDAAVVANRIISQLETPIRITRKSTIAEVSVGASIGIVIIPVDGVDRTTLLRNADTAMYAAKEKGNSFVFYTEELNKKALHRLLLEEEMRRDIQDQNFLLYYQPIVGIKSQILGLEALLRWPSKQGTGVRKPAEFLSIAEDTGLIVPINKWVIRTACYTAKRLYEKGFKDLFIAVNVTPKLLEKTYFPQLVKSYIEEAGVHPRNLAIEITESTMLRNPELIIETLKELTGKDVGVRIAVDDFGTGFSSLEYLSRLPVSILKIDQTFVRQISRQSDRHIIEAIIGLGKTLGLDIIAEGIETDNQFAYLIDKGCSTFQGFKFSKPVPLEDLETIL